MKITMYYEDKNHPTILEVPDEECTVMVETDYQQRLETAVDKSAVKRRTIQEIVDEEVNKPTFNSNHAETRRHVSLATFDPEDKSFIGVPDVETDLFDEDYADLYQAIKKLKKHQRELLRKVFWKGMKQVEIARDISRINAQFFEMDSGTFEEQQAKVDAFPLPPSMVIRTQKSLHVYYFMDSTAKVERFRPIQKQLVKQFNGDPMCVNESRVMRLPGFNHCKKEPVKVECISFHPERKYTQDQLSDILPQIDEQPVEKKSGSGKGLDIVMRSCDFLKHCRDDAASLSEHDWYAMITNLASFEGGTELIHEMSAPYPAYSENATQKKINHFLESGTKPITCKTICEKGFNCPKFASGECKVKSPAALCYQPLSSDALMDILHALPVVGDSIKDLQTAKQFVTDYLYNQDVVMAEVFINGEIRDHFKFRATYLKPLNAVYKDISRAYKASKEAKRARAGILIPDWYEPMDSGLRFLPGVLAKEMGEKEQIFYAAEQHFSYRGGVYSGMTEMEAQRMVQEKMLVRETKMHQIIDAEKQWRLMVQKDIRELNANERRTACTRRG